MNEPVEQQNVSRIQSEHFLALPGQHVIQTNPDGRCLFRSVVICEDVALQSAERDGNGLPIDASLKVLEQIRSDMIRLQMVQHILDNLDQYKEYEDTINLDMPTDNVPTFQSLQERACYMTSDNTPVGGLEILATARVLEREIHVVMTSDGRTVKFAENEFQGLEPVVVLYRCFGDNSGHYDCLVQSDSVSLIQNKPTSEAKSSALLKKRNDRKTETQVLISSPYKRKLIESLDKAAMKKIPKRSRNKRQEPLSKSKKPEKKSKKSPTATLTSDWFCFICTENTQEDMIQCTKCQLWVHVECGGATVNQRGYVCDICQTNK